MSEHRGQEDTLGQHTNDRTGAEKGLAQEWKGELAREAERARSFIRNAVSDLVGRSKCAW